MQPGMNDLGYSTDGGTTDRVLSPTSSALVIFGILIFLAGVILCALRERRRQAQPPPPPPPVQVQHLELPPLVQQDEDEAAAAAALSRVQRSAFSVEEGGEDIECTLCLTEYEEGEELALLGCGHKYKIACITKWLRVNTNCPLCRADV